MKISKKIKKKKQFDNAVEGGIEEAGQITVCSGEKGSFWAPVTCTSQVTSCQRWNLVLPSIALKKVEYKKRINKNQIKRSQRFIKIN